MISEENVEVGINKIMNSPSTNEACFRVEVMGEILKEEKVKEYIIDSLARYLMGNEC